MSEGLIVSLFSGAVPLLLAALAALGARNANRRAALLEAGKADTTLLERVQRGYETLLTSLEERIAKLQGEVDRVNRLLAEERTANDALHTQMRELRAQQDQALAHKQIISALYAQIVGAGLTPVVVIGDDLRGQTS